MASAGASDDASMGFRPSSAPPLDPSVSKFVSPSLLRQYQQSANFSSGGAGDAAPAPSKGHRGQSVSDAVPADDATSMVADNSPPSTPKASLAAYADPGGHTPAAVIFFPGDGTALSASGRAQVRKIVQVYQSGGEQGFIKVVGHSSSRTQDMPVQKHLALIFRRSKDRANAVAHELIREGIPAQKVLVDAVGDSQPVYYESMPAGEEGNRRAEIFLQS